MPQTENIFPENSVPAAQPPLTNLADPLPS